MIKLPNKLIEYYTVERIKRMIYALSLADIITLELTPTVRFEKDSNGLGLVCEFSDEDLEKIKKHKPDWNGLVSFPSI